MQPTQIGRYEIVRVLGQGAMGVVYEAFDPRLGRRVAIKTIRVENLGTDQAMAYEARFDTEARAVARLSHPHIVSVYDYGQLDGQSFLVMELVSGVNLKECLRAGVRFTPRGAVQVVQGVLAGLIQAHEQRIIHRDIKPDNVLLDVTGQVKLTDFGIAKMLDAEVDNGTQLSGLSIGTPRYMSPEQVRGWPLDARSDVFSAAVLLYELLTGAPPFDGGSAIAIASAILHDDVVPPSQRLDGIPTALDGVLAAALSKSVHQRLESARALSDALAAIPWPPEAEVEACPADARPVPRPGWLAGVQPGSEAVLTTLMAGMGLTMNTPQRSGTGSGLRSHSGAGPTAESAHISPSATPDVPLDGDVTAVVAPPTPSFELHRSPASETVSGRRRSPARVGLLAAGVLLVGLAGWLWRERAEPSPALTPSPVVQDPSLSLAENEKLVQPTPVAAPKGPITQSEPAAQGVPGTPASSVPAAARPVTRSTQPVSTPGLEASGGSSPGASAVKTEGASSRPAAPAVASPVGAPPVGGDASSAPRKATEPCVGLSFLQRESCLWTQCATEGFRSHPACERFQPAKSTP